LADSLGVERSPKQSLQKGSDIERCHQCLPGISGLGFDLEIKPHKGQESAEVLQRPLQEGKSSLAQPRAELSFRPEASQELKVPRRRSAHPEERPRGRSPADTQPHRRLARGQTACTAHARVEETAARALTAAVPPDPDERSPDPAQGHQGHVAPPPARPRPNREHPGPCTRKKETPAPQSIISMTDRGEPGPNLVRAATGQAASRRAPPTHTRGGGGTQL
jgi:hypothetical protein